MNYLFLSPYSAEALQCEAQILPKSPYRKLLQITAKLLLQNKLTEQQAKILVGLARRGKYQQAEELKEKFLEEKP